METILLNAEEKIRIEGENKKIAYGFMKTSISPKKLKNQSGISDNPKKLECHKGDYYTKKAYTQQNSWRTISAKRGTITDRNGNVLAISVSSYLVNVNQKIIHDNPSKGMTVEQYQEKIAKGLSQFLNMDYNHILKQIKTERGKWQL